MINRARQRSLSVYHLHMGGPDAAALEWKALLSPRFVPRLRQMGVTPVSSPANADVTLVTGLLLEKNVGGVLARLAEMPQPSALITAGDSAISGAPWVERTAAPSTHTDAENEAIETSDEEAQSPSRIPHSAFRIHPYALSHYADVQISVPGDPPTPQALLAALAAAAELLSTPGEQLPPWQD